MGDKKMILEGPITPEEIKKVRAFFNKNIEELKGELIAC